MKNQKEDLYDLLGKGTIDLDEFVARLRLLHAQLKGKKKIAEKLGWQISEVAKTAAKQHKDKASKLKGLNQMIRDEMKTALEELKETVKGHGQGRWKRIKTDRTTTSTSNKGRGRGKGGKKP